MLGKGATATIYKIYHKNDRFRRPYVLKEMEKFDIKETEYIMKEVKIHSQLDSPYIVRYFDFFETEKYCYIVLEYCENKDLYDYVVNNRLSEAEILRIFN